MSPREHRHSIPFSGLTMLAALGAILVAAAYWPGLMTWDAIRQYGQAIDGSFDDWHPPAMGWVWRQLIPIHTGPAPMLVLQLSLYWGGYALLACWGLRRRGGGFALALLACGCLPLALALMGAVLKDCLMAGALLSASGLLAWTVDRPERRWIWALRLPAALLLLFAASLRFNAFLACLPLLVALVPPRWRAGRARLAAVSLLAGAILAAAMPLANRSIGAEPSGVQLSLVIFDLGGITEHAGVDVFPPLGVADPVAVNHRCYTPVKWDSYSDWVDPECPLGFTRFKAYAEAGGRSPYGWWIDAVAAHPLAYAAHRLAHANINLRFLVRGQVERPVQIESAPNPWRYRVTPGALLTSIDEAAAFSARTPLGWPILWLALALGALLIGRMLPSRRIIVPVALSALLYGATYAVLSVASELRYHLWTMAASLLATLLVVNDLRDARRIAPRRVAGAFAPALLVLCVAVAWRLSALGPTYNG